MAAPLSVNKMRDVWLTLKKGPKLHEIIPQLKPDSEAVTGDETYQLVEQLGETPVRQVAALMHAINHAGDELFDNKTKIKAGQSRESFHPLKMLDKIITQIFNMNPQLFTNGANSPWAAKE